MALVVALHSIFHASLAHPHNPWPADVRERVQRSTVTEGALLQRPAGGARAGHTGPRRPPGDRRHPHRRVRDAGGGGWRLSGRKIYTTGIPRLRSLAVWARTDGAGDGEGNGAGEPLVGTFLVEAGTPGYRVEPTWDHLGIRATRSDDVIFDDVEVPPARAVALATAGRLPIEALDPAFLAWNNLVLSSIYHGVALAARDWLVGYLNERTPTSLGAPLATLPRFQQAVGEIEALLHANGRLIHGTAAEVDDGPDRDAAGARLGAGQADRHRQRHPGGRDRHLADRQPRPVPPQPPRAALPGRAVQPHPHAPRRHDRADGRSRRPGHPAVGTRHKHEARIGQSSGHTSGTGGGSFPAAVASDSRTPPPQRPGWRSCSGGSAAK